MSTESDKVLIERIRTNSKKSRAFEEACRDLVDRYRGRISAYIRCRLKDPGTLDDVVQETFIGFFNSLPHYDDKRELQTWLFTIASHKVTDQLRRSGRNRLQVGCEFEDDLDRSPDGKQRVASSLARSQEKRGKEEEALGRGLQQMVRELIHRGDYSSVMLLELMFVKGYGNKDSANIVGVSEQQVANIKFQSKKRLHDFMCQAKLSPDVFPELIQDSN